MISTITSGNDKYEYDDSKDEVKVNGVVNKDFKSMSVPNGDSEPTFFGVVNEKLGFGIDLNGRRVKLHNPDSITL